jgi:hypothetical protein
MNNPKNQGKETGQQEEGTNANNRKLKTSIDTLTNAINAQRAEQKEGDQQKWSKRTAIAAITYTTFTFLIMIVSGYQSYLTRQATIVSQRAFVSVGFKLPFLAIVPSGGPVAPPQGILQALSQGVSEIGSLNYVVELTNSGNTGTKGLLFLAKCVPSSIGDLPDPWPLLKGTKNPEKTPQYIGPHSSGQTICGFDIDQVRAMSTEKLNGYIMVDVDYRDRLDDSVPHKAQATFKLTQVRLLQAPGQGGSLGLNQVSAVVISFGRHNCADEECPPD